LIHPKFERDAPLDAMGGRVEASQAPLGAGYCITANLSIVR